MDQSTTSSPGGGNLDDVEEIAPGSKQGNEGTAAHGGDVEGPSSDDAGRPLAPQTGEPIDHAH